MISVRFWSGLMAVAVIVFANGCDNTDPGSVVHGSVLIDGKPLPGAELQLVPKSDKTLGSHTTNTGPDGTFTLKAAAANTPVRPGVYTVVVNKWSSNAGGMDGMKNEVPTLYQQQESTPLTLTIAEGESTIEPLQLSTKGTNASTSSASKSGEEP